MKKHLIKIVLLITILICLLYLGIKDASINTNYDDLFYAKVGTDRIQIYMADDGNYLFLPSYAQEYKLSTAVDELDSLKILHSSNIATIYINTTYGKLQDIYGDKYTQLKGSIKIVDDKGFIDYEGAIDTLTGRGNTSWNSWEKKALSISFKSDESILGMSRGTKYALLANASDATLIRNDIAQSLAEIITAAGGTTDNIPYTCKGRFADLYIDGEYLGNYYLCPTVAVGADRVDIEGSNYDIEQVYKDANIEAIDDYVTEDIQAKNIDIDPEDYTGGYLLESEYYERYKQELDNNLLHAGFRSRNDKYFAIKYPKAISGAQAEYLKSFIDDMEAALESEDFINPYTNQQLEEYLDIGSMAKRYLIQEITANYDGAVSSEYYYKNSDDRDGRLYAGPVWDFDMSMGNYVYWMSYATDEEIGITKLKNASTEAWWYVRLYEYNPYLDIVKTIYAEEARTYLQSLIDYRIGEYEDMLSSSASMDSIRWHSMYENLGHHCGDTESYQYLKAFLQQRVKILDEEWL